MDVKVLKWNASLKLKLCQAEDVQDCAAVGRGVIIFMLTMLIMFQFIKFCPISFA